MMMVKVLAAALAAMLLMGCTGSNETTGTSGAPTAAAPTLATAIAEVPAIQTEAPRRR